MSLPETYLSYSVDEYLALEREAEERSEYLDGLIYLMAGENPEHGRICTNINGQLYNQLAGSGCESFSKDMKVRSGPTPVQRNRTKGLYSYPDIIVVCGELKFLDEHRDVLLNPVVIVEVLSPGTEAFDRGEKWARYQSWLPELSEYLLVSQTKPRVERYHRQANGEWSYTRTEGIEAALSLSSVDCTLRLADVYDRVCFPEQDDLDDAEQEEEH